ncbi:MAG: hypothetical protein JWN17_476, partial [Frankiales bacterium]|nr:hypothetical protein [Frankiales bacterium]
MTGLPPDDDGALDLGAVARDDALVELLRGGGTAALDDPAAGLLSALLSDVAVAADEAVRARLL